MDGLFLTRKLTDSALVVDSIEMRPRLTRICCYTCLRYPWIIRHEAGASSRHSYTYPWEVGDKFPGDSVSCRVQTREKCGL